MKVTAETQFEKSHAIEHVEVISIALPVRREWRWRGLQGSLGRWVIVKMHAGGLVGVGEAAPLPDWGGDFNRYGGETPSTVRHMIESFLAPVITGLDPFNVEAALSRMDEVVRGHSYAKAAIEMAMHDLQGKLARKPLYQMFGGPSRSGVRVAHMIGIMPRGEAVAEARAALDDGCTAFQIKGTGDLDHDLGVVIAVRDVVADRISLRFDANQGYRRIGQKEAIKAARALEAAGIEILEQPTEGLRGMAAVRNAVSATVIADESCWKPEDVVAAAEADAIDAVSIYIAKAGGLTNAKKVAVVAEAFGFVCDVNGSLESGVGNAANVHLAAAMPSISLPCVIPATVRADGTLARTAGRYYEDDIVADSFAYADGIVYPPEGHGLGIELDEDKVEKYRVP